MGPKMQPVIVSRELVIPFSSTPNDHPTIHHLSFFDQYMPSTYVPLLFFYTRKNNEDDHPKSGVLKNSLSMALSQYYPLAGRFKDDVTVDCNDKGALFVEAHMECDLSAFLKSPSDELLRALFPNSLFWKDSSLRSPVAIQATYFKCGGMSIGLCLCHRMMEMASMSSFIYDWASLARDSKRKIGSPEFKIGSFYPPLDVPIPKQLLEIPEDRKGIASRRFVFDGSNIAELKAIVANQVSNPTRVEVVSALVYKSAMKAAARASSSGSLKPSAMNHAINFQAYLSPPLPRRNKGNSVGMLSVYVTENKEPTLEVLVEEFRRSKTRFLSSFANASNKEEVCLMALKSWIPKGEHELYICTSWCRNPLYECDFGWGKPLWVATTWLKINNVMCLIDTKEGDGIEVFMAMEEKVMAELERDQELLSFCSLNPSVFPM